MTTEKLKTLNELEFDLDEASVAIGKALSGESTVNNELVMKGSLKKEAIKWIQMFRRTGEISGEKRVYNYVALKFMEFFNISGKDLGEK